MTHRMNMVNIFPLEVPGFQALTLSGLRRRSYTLFACAAGTRGAAWRSPETDMTRTAGAVIAVLASLIAAAGQEKKPPTPATATTASDTATRQRILDMFARAYFPGRSGQLMIAPREGHFITRNEPDVTFMHGSPWTYDVAIPLLFAGPAVKAGVYPAPAVQQDVAPTLAAALGVRMPTTATGRVLPILRPGFARPKAVFLIVLDGFRRDYFDRYADVLPTLTALKRSGAWFSQASVNVLPSNTAVGHATISTGTDPRFHGITGNNGFDHARGQRVELFADMSPKAMMALTLADVWQFSTSGRAVIIAQGSIGRASTPLAGHGACQPNGSAVLMAGYDETTGIWRTNDECFRFPAYLKDRQASTLWSTSRTWLDHPIDAPASVRRSALFPAFEADAITTILEREPVGQDDVTDLVLLNYKAADFVGHPYGPESNEVRVTLTEMDRQLARVIAALEARVGKDYLLAVTADHGMPSAPPERRHLSVDVIDLVHQKFDPQEKKLVSSYEGENAQLFINRDRLRQLGLSLRDLARFLEAQPFVFSVFTEDEVRHADVAGKRLTSF
jgi:type I phosphodiesterase/nucleotide pyrophosphatase